MDITKQKRIASIASSRSIVTRSLSGAKVNASKLTFPKRKAESPLQTMNKKAVFKDLTNREANRDPSTSKLQHDITTATKRLAKAKISSQVQKTSVILKKKVKPTATASNTTLNSYFPVTKHPAKLTISTQKSKQETTTLKEIEVLASISIPPARNVRQPETSQPKPDRKELSKKDSQKDEKQTLSQKDQKSTSPRDSVSPLYVTALENLSNVNDSSENDQSTLLDPTIPPKRLLPPGVSDFDADNWTDTFQVSNYATDIFEYFKSVEPVFSIKPYINLQDDLTTAMRAVVVDWLVQLQEEFELNHETLYLGVKILDSYLSKVKVSRKMLQLVAATSLFIASKYDERFPPSIADYLYVCENAYDKKQLIATEISILQQIDFNLGFPISYRFLRRYARFGKISMPTLTLARYILETSLLDYSFVSVSDSELAASALLLALKMKGINDWSPNLGFVSGYSLENLKTMTSKLHNMLAKASISRYATVKSKYSHKIFFEVAKLPHLSSLDF